MVKSLHIDVAPAYITVVLIGLYLILNTNNRNLKLSKAPLKSQAHQGTSLFTSVATNQRGVSKGSREAQVRFPEYQEGTQSKLAVRPKLGVVQMGKVNVQNPHRPFPLRKHNSSWFLKNISKCICYVTL